MTAQFTHKALHSIHTHGKLYPPNALMVLNAAEAEELERLEAAAPLTEEEIVELEAREQVAARRAAGKKPVDGLVTKEKPETKADKAKRLAEEKAEADRIAAGGVVYKLDADGNRVLDADGNPIVDDGFGE